MGYRIRDLVNYLRPKPETTGDGRAVPSTSATRDAGEKELRPVEEQGRDRETLPGGISEEASSKVPEQLFVAGVYCKYVNHSKIPEWEKLGWKRGDTLPGHHAYWSILMYWPHEGEPKCPPKKH